MSCFGGCISGVCSCVTCCCAPCKIVSFSKQILCCEDNYFGHKPDENCVRILISSSSHQRRNHLKFDVMPSYNADVIILAGDNINTDEMPLFDCDNDFCWSLLGNAMCSKKVEFNFKEEYDHLLTRDDFPFNKQSFLSSNPPTVICTWNDHDVGRGDDQSLFSRKSASKQAFIAWHKRMVTDESLRDKLTEIDDESDRGVYYYHDFFKRLSNGTEINIRFVLLDVRYNRMDDDLLGNAQWVWLDETLSSTPNYFNKIVFIYGTTMLFDQVNFGFGSFPSESWDHENRNRLFDLLHSKNVFDKTVLVSGGVRMHCVNELIITDDELKNKNVNVYEYVSSSLSHSLLSANAFGFGCLKSLSNLFCGKNIAKRVTPVNNCNGFCILDINADSSQRFGVISNDKNYAHMSHRSTPNIFDSHNDDMKLKINTTSVDDDDDDNVNVNVNVNVDDEHDDDEDDFDHFNPSNVLMDLRMKSIAEDDTTKEKFNDDLKGWLLKQHPKMAHFWQKRWVVVKESYMLWAEEQIEIDDVFNINERQRFKRSVSFCNTDSITAVDSNSQDKFKVSLKIDEKKNKRRDFVFKANTQMERDRWVSELAKRSEHYINFFAS